MYVEEEKFIRELETENPFFSSFFFFCWRSAKYWTTSETTRMLTIIRMVSFSFSGDDLKFVLNILHHKVRVTNRKHVSDSLCISSSDAAARRRPVPVTFASLF